MQLLLRIKINLLIKHLPNRRDFMTVPLKICDT
jgi:hypothetical protein